MTFRLITIKKTTEFDSQNNGEKILKKRRQSVFYLIAWENAKRKKNKRKKENNIIWKDAAVDFETPGIAPKEDYHFHRITEGTEIETQEKKGGGEGAPLTRNREDQNRRLSPLLERFLVFYNTIPLSPNVFLILG